MKNQARFLVVLLPLAVLSVVELCFVWPNLFYLSLVLSLFIIVAGLKYLSPAAINENWWSTLILPSLFLVSLIIYASLQINGWFVQFLFFILTIFLYNYFKNIYYAWFRLEAYHPEERDLIRSYGSFLAIFLLGCDIYGLQSLISLPLWPMLLIFAVFVVALLGFLDLRLPEVTNSEIWQFTGLLSWLIVASAWAVSLWPLNYNVLGLIVGIVYYLLVNLTRLHLLKALTANKIKFYVGVSLGGLIIIILTARWL
jgi:hypothetical protein